MKKKTIFIILLLAVLALLIASVIYPKFEKIERDSGVPIVDFAQRIPSAEFLEFNGLFDGLVPRVYATEYFPPRYSEVIARVLDKKDGLQESYYPDKGKEIILRNENIISLEFIEAKPIPGKPPLTVLEGGVSYVYLKDSLPQLLKVGSVIKGILSKEPGLVGASSFYLSEVTIISEPEDEDKIVVPPQTSTTSVTDQEPLSSTSTTSVTDQAPPQEQKTEKQDSFLTNIVTTRTILITVSIILFALLFIFRASIKNKNLFIILLLIALILLTASIIYSKFEKIERDSVVAAAGQVFGEIPLTPVFPPDLDLQQT